jgi:ubiquinone/menaquinone biosynthesis C-methylase UbiE
MNTQHDPERNEQRMIERFADFAGKRVLEVGCGDGRMTWEYAGKAGRVCGIDPNKDDLRLAQADRSYKLEGKVFFAQASARWLPFPRERFDIAVLAWSL